MELQWHFRIRAECLRGKLPPPNLLVKSNTWIHRPGKGWKQLNQYYLAMGESILLQGVGLTKTNLLTSLNQALGRDPLSGQIWLVVSDEPVSVQTFREYGQRFQIEEELLDEKSNGFQLERSDIRSAPALSRLCFVLAVATLLLTVQGQEVVTSLKRRWVEPHWRRGSSYLRIGWNWLKGVLHQGWQLFPTISLNGRADPEPASASKKQTQKQFEREFTIKSYKFSS